jgi:hypothetical protein
LTTSLDELRKTFSELRTTPDESTFRCPELTTSFDELRKIFSELRKAPDESTFRCRELTTDPDESTPKVAESSPIASE